MSKKKEEKKLSIFSQENIDFWNLKIFAKDTKLSKEEIDYIKELFDIINDYILNNNLDIKAMKEWCNTYQLETLIKQNILLIEDITKKYYPKEEARYFDIDLQIKNIYDYICLRAKGQSIRL